LQSRILRAVPETLMYIECMSRKVATTVHLDVQDARALQRARKDGLSSSGLIRRGLRVVAARYYRRRSPPETGLFLSTDAKLGDESELFKDVED
jgi:hypothetical protein